LFSWGGILVDDVFFYPQMGANGCKYLFETICGFICEYLWLFVVISHFDTSTGSVDAGSVKRMWMLFVVIDGQFVEI